MSLLTPGSLQYIVGLAILSRLIVFLIQLISNIIIVDHNADAYRNKYHLALNEARSVSPDIPDVYRHFYNSIQGFTKWDSQYFLEISNDGYLGEQQLAFLPLFPIIVSTVRQFLFEHKSVDLNLLLSTRGTTSEEQVIQLADIENYIRSAVVGFALNNFIFFPVATVSLFVLTKLVKREDEKYAKSVVWWFCFNPASVFFSACYTESLFAALTFTAMLVIEYKSRNYLANHEDSAKVGKESNKLEFKPLSQLNRLLHICLPCLALLALSSATRSNGLVSIGFLCYQFLLKYSPIIQLNRSQWSLMVYISVVLECIQDLLVVLMSTVIAASGYITFQIYSYIKFCLHENNNRKGVLWIKPHWCENSIPHPYGQVQAKHWNVGLFNYYQLKQLPNFLLAFPMSCLVLFGSLKSSKNLSKTHGGEKQLPYYLQGIILTIFCGISINVQVTTRLLASTCPVVYWIFADTAEPSRTKSKMLLLYSISYFTIGTMLHVNFYPWT